jgi:hypothetical protein
MEKKNKFSYVSLKETSIPRLMNLKVSEITEKIQNYVWELQYRANSLKMDSMKA